MRKIREMLMDKKVFIGLMIVILSAITLGIVLTPYLTGQSNSEKELNYMMKYMRYPQFPKSVNTELYQLKKEKPFAVNKWEIDEKHKQIVIYVVWMSARRFDKPQIQRIDDWNVTIIPDTEMIAEMGTVEAEMNRIEQTPEMQVAGYTLQVGNGRIEIFVYLYNYTPGNRELLKNGLRGWKVDGGPVATPPPSPSTTLR
ncbi:MAG: hypothetical protein WC406_09285 [Methanoregula sp.]|nr:hypothetical protein [Methanoregula sp.]